MKISSGFEKTMTDGSVPVVDLKKLSDKELVASAKNTATHEREYMTGFLRHLIEIQVRGLYAANHPSLFQFVRETFGYDEASTQRRIDAATLLKEFPSIEPFMRSGALNLSNLAQARTFFRQEKKLGNDLSSARKLNILLGLSGKSVTEGFDYLLSQSANPESHTAKKKSHLRSIGNGRTSVRYIADEALSQKLKRIKDLLAHAVPDGDIAALTDRMADALLEKIDPLKKAERARARWEQKEQKAIVTSTSDSVIGSDKEDSEARMSRLSSEPRRPRARVRHEIILRDYEGGCTHMDEHGRRCGSQHGLEFDHAVPYALGGPSSIENGRLLCRVHNSYHARQDFGHDTISQKTASTWQARSELRSADRL